MAHTLGRPPLATGRSGGLGEAKLRGGGDDMPPLIGGRSPALDQGCHAQLRKACPRAVPAHYPQPQLPANSTFSFVPTLWNALQAKAKLPLEKYRYFVARTRSMAKRAPFCAKGNFRAS
jgi:hypothetical protein